MCGVVGIYNTPDVFNDTFESLHKVQHRGQEGAGVIFADGGERFLPPAPHRVLGLAENCFNTWPGETPQNVLLGVGHLRYGTSGEHENINNVQPFVFGQFAIVHNGDTRSYKALREELLRDGVCFESTSDTEIFGHLIIRHSSNDFLTAVRDVLSTVQSAFAMIIATPKTLIGCRDPYGYRPLSLGKLGDGYILASETLVFRPLGARFIRDILPGEMVVIDEAGIRSIILKKNVDNFQQCAFEQIYFSHPASETFGKKVFFTRIALGRALAREYGPPRHPDPIVVGVPDSAIFIADGVADEWGMVRTPAIIRSHHTGRTFTKPKQAEREKGVRLKYDLIPELIKGRWCYVPDDSIIRGTTSKKIVRLVREAGATGVSMLVACPPNAHPCLMGIDMKTYKELFAARHGGDIGAMREEIGADELVYLSLEGLQSVIAPANDHCFACFTGEYAL